MLRGALSRKVLVEDTPGMRALLKVTIDTEKKSCVLDQRHHGGLMLVCSLLTRFTGP